MTLLLSLLLSLHCGVERQTVKTCVDPDAWAIPVESPQAATVEELVALTPPAYDDKAPRHPEESAVYEVRGEVVAYKLEADSDYHVVLRGQSGATMVVEFPDPACALGSRFIAEIKAARLAFRKLVRTPPTARMTKLRKPVAVRLTGVIYFDRVHGQLGGAASGAEIHPVLSVEAAKP